MSTSETTTNPTLALELVLARNDLTSFVQQQARDTGARVGFTYEGCPDAPSTYQQLRGAYAESQANGTPLPIYNQFCDTSIFFQDEDNICFRFWHDVSHMQLGLSFQLDDELELGIWHLEQLERAGFPKYSLPWQVFRADIVGQIQLMALIGRFPIHQRRFVEECVEYGTEIGLIEEIRRVPEPDAPCPSRSDILVTS
ncbi:hypothetical protein [Leekyejoonella antrihumi]|uniref:Uncharacterized protein n=1 Tax=Leekyejoonella antrihumi TaxID=1660198 RepID=A0A563DVX4_9MICO|nr:hypothetical protein [Leekyejoonella antrihumi]TWP34345.1 hypothetical protein FGL98_18115 [Leekyejoonella antrihumi]